MNVELIEVSRIDPAPYNPRKDLRPGDPEYERLARSIDEFGFVEPLVWNKRTGTLVGGHQRLKVLLARGEKRVECSVVDLPLEREKGLNVGLNKIAGAWDEGKLAAVLAELTRVPDFDVSLTGFDLPEVSQLLDRFSPGEGDDEFDVDAALEEIKEPETQRGDVIELGPHRVLCGDSTDAAELSRLMGSERAHLVFTDPPYAVDYRGGRIGEACPEKIRQDGERYRDQMSAGEYEQLLVGALTNARDVSDEQAPLYLWFACARIKTVLGALDQTGWAQRSLLMWVKSTFAGCLFAQYKYQYEPCFYCHKRGKVPRWYGPKNETTVWQADKPSRNEDHPTIKPLVLAERAVRNSSKRGDLVLDLFLGSGTTLIAAEALGRRCYGVELEPRYCDVIRKRYEQCVALAGRIR